jgi:hypothetical protein
VKFLWRASLALVQKDYYWGNLWYFYNFALLLYHFSKLTPLVSFCCDHRKIGKAGMDLNVMYGPCLYEVKVRHARQTDVRVRHERQTWEGLDGERCWRRGKKEHYQWFCVVIEKLWDTLYAGCEAMNKLSGVWTWLPVASLEWGALILDRELRNISPYFISPYFISPYLFISVLCLTQAALWTATLLWSR